jgi:hypothetical protein
MAGNHNFRKRHKHKLLRLQLIFKQQVFKLYWLTVLFLYLGGSILRPKAGHPREFLYLSSFFAGKLRDRIHPVTFQNCPPIRCYMIQAAENA